MVGYARPNEIVLTGRICCRRAPCKLEVMGRGRHKLASENPYPGRKFLSASSRQVSFLRRLSWYSFRPPSRVRLQAWMQLVAPRARGRARFPCVRGPRSVRPLFHQTLGFKALWAEPRTSRRTPRFRSMNPERMFRSHRRKTARTGRSGLLNPQRTTQPSAGRTPVHP